jgi:hypothetical protein
VGPREKRSNSNWTYSEVTARFEYGPVENPIGVASFRGKYMIEGKSLDLDRGEWISRPTNNTLALFKLSGTISRDNRVLSGRSLAAIACAEFSMASDPGRADELIASGQQKADERQSHRDAQLAKRQAQELEKDKTRTHLVSVKTGEPVRCPTWQKSVDENGKTRRFCNGEEVMTKYYLDPKMKRHAIGGRGKAYMEAMGLKFADLSNKMKATDLLFSDLVWSEPIIVRDVNGYAPPVNIVLGCRTKMYYCSPTFQYADAVFLVDESYTLGVWFVNQETGMAQSCRISKEGLNCIRPEKKLGESFNEVFIWPSGIVNPLFAVNEQVKRSFEWARFNDKERAAETARIQRVNKEFFEMIRGVAEAAFASKKEEDCDNDCQSHRDWADRQNRAGDWASRERGRQPDQYRGN